MTVSHPDPGEYERFLRGDLSEGENRRIVHFLLMAWRTCREELGQLWEGNWPRGARDYGAAFQNLLPTLSERARAVSRERQRLPELIARLKSRCPKEQELLRGLEEESRSWLFCEWLIEEAQRFLYTDPGEARELADLGVAIGEVLDPKVYGDALIRDLQARSWACLGEVLRALSDLRSAERAFATAMVLIARGTGDALEQARILELKAALRRDQRRPDEAHKLLDKAIGIYRQYRDRHLVGRALVQKGRVHGRCDEPELAVRWLRKGLSLIDSGRDRLLELSARHSLMLYLQESGRHREARFLVKASRAEFLQYGGELLNLHLQWLDGKIHGSLGLPDPAEEALDEARQGFIRLGVGFSAAMTSLDLAALYARQGRPAEIRRLSAEMLPIFQSRDLHQEAVAALIAFQQAVKLERVNAELLTDLRSYLGRARKDPQLRFDPA